MFWMDKFKFNKNNKYKKEEESAPMFVIAGLGNPGEKYEKTRHNVGFDVIDVLADQYNINVRDKKCRALCGSGIIGGQKVLLVKPQTFMNLSGESIAAILKFYKLDPASQLLVIFDDISLEPGKLRIRRKGSAGGHNGIKNIIALCGGEDFMRIRIGVGAKPADWDLVDHVLGRFPKAERALVEEAMKDAADAAALLVKGEIDAAMNRYN